MSEARADGSKVPGNAASKASKIEIAKKVTPKKAAIKKVVKKAAK
ncbi:MAG: hypothetical protein ABIX01_14355 [Chitinophagaceae bacterium]